VDIVIIITRIIGITIILSLFGAIGWIIKELLGIDIND